MALRLFRQCLELQSLQFMGNLQFKRPFILACLASGIGGAIIGFGGVKQYSAGTNGIFSEVTSHQPTDRI